MRESDAPVAIIGFGYVGACLAALLILGGRRVVAIDSDGEVAEAIRSGSLTTPEPGVADTLNEAVAGGSLVAVDASGLAAAEVVIVCVGTPLRADGTADIGPVLEAIRAAAPHLSNGALLILKSTLPPGVTSNVIIPALQSCGRTADDDDLSVVYCPERMAEGSALPELRHNPMLVGGASDRGRDRAMAFWSTLGVPVRPLANPSTAELAKLADNLWIDVNVALSTELARLCDAIGGIDVLEVIAAANSLPKGDHHVNYLTPSVGVGGSCLVKDPWFLVSLGKDHGAPQSLAAAARNVNDSQPSFAVARLVDGLREGGRELAGSQIAVLGLAYKTGTGDVRATPAAGFIDEVLAAGASVRAFDPLVTELPADLAAVRVASFVEAIDGCDAIAVLAGHGWPESHTVSQVAALVRPGCVLFDGRLFLDRAAIEAATEAGFVYRGIGR